MFLQKFVRNGPEIYFVVSDYFVRNQVLQKCNEKSTWQLIGAMSMNGGRSMGYLSTI